MSERALYILAHVASQLVYRWLPPPNNAGEALPFGARWPPAASVDPEIARALGKATTPRRSARIGCSKVGGHSGAVKDDADVATKGRTADLRDDGVRADGVAAADDASLLDTLIGGEPPHAEAHDPACEVEPWRSLIATELAASSPRLTWLRHFSARYDPDGTRLARAATRQVALLATAGGLFVTPADATYPVLLRFLADPPHALAVLGDPARLAGACVSIVGSRKASGLAVRESFALGRDLAEAGYVVVSGGAFGCDIAAHHGVLAAVSAASRSRAICVFAGGLSDLYPHAHGPVFRRLRAAGAAFVSERLWESPSRPVDFAARNRLIAGLSPVTAVMQAGLRSGAMVTARLALDAGRQVVVLRHPLDDIRADGSRMLLEAGGPGFSSARALVESLTLSDPSMPTGEPLRSPCRRFHHPPGCHERK